MQRADRGVERGELCEVRRTHGENAADQDPLDVLRALRRAVDHQDRGRGRDDVEDAHERLATHIARDAAREREKRRADGREHERITETCRAGRRVPVREGHRRAQRRELREREIGEDDVPAQHMNAKVSMNEDENDRRREGQQEQRQRVFHRRYCGRAPSARASVVTLSSNSAK